MMLQTELKDFFSFLRKPTLKRLPPESPILKGDLLRGVVLRRLIVYCLLCWAMALCVFAPISLAVARALGGDNAVEDLLLNKPISFIILFGLIKAPLLEELLFRYGLRRPVQWLCSLPFVLYGIFYIQTWQGFLIFFLIYVSGLFVLNHYLNRYPASFKTRRRYKRLFPYWMYLTVICFALMHIGNYRLDNGTWYVLPLLVLPQLFLGSVLAWIRVRHGIGMSILTHSLYNAGPILLVLAATRFIL